jgi:hypothetical protein
MSATTKLVAFIWVAATLALVALAMIDYDPQFRLYYSNALQTLSSLAAAGACFYAMLAFPAQSPLRAVWGAIGTGVLAWGIGATIFGAYYLATGPLMVVGLLLFKRATGLETPLWGQAAALLAFLGSAFLAYQANAEGIADPSMAMKATSIGYTLFDPAVLGATVLVATSFRGGDVAKAWWYVVAGILLYFVANQLYTYLVLTEQYTTGHAIDAGWMLGFGLIAWAALKTRHLLD